MTAQIPLSWREHATMPPDPAQRQQWAIEKAIELAADYDEPELLECARVTLGWATDEWSARLDDLAHIGNDAALAELRGQYKWVDAFAADYRAALETLAAGPAAPRLVTS